MPVLNGLYQNYPDYSIGRRRFQVSMDWSRDPQKTTLFFSLSFQARKRWTVLQSVKGRGHLQDSRKVRKSGGGCGGLVIKIFWKVKVLLLFRPKSGSTPCPNGSTVLMIFKAKTKTFFAWNLNLNWTNQ